MSKTNPKGRYLSLSPSRKFLLMLARHAQKVPSVLVVRKTNIRALVEARSQLAERPSWAAVFMKAYGTVAARRGEFRRAFFAYPWPRLYEHPINICSLAIEREWQGELGVFFTLIRKPEEWPLAGLTECIRRHKTVPVEDVGFFRQAIRFSRLPRWLTWPMVWSTLNVMGYKRAKRLGTFSLSAYGGLGAESFHAVSPLTTTMSYGVIEPNGEVALKLMYDHRVLDGATVARALTETDHVLQTSILEELQSLGAGEGETGAGGQRLRLDRPLPMIGEPRPGHGTSSGNDYRPIEREDG